MQIYCIWIIRCGLCHCVHFRLAKSHLLWQTNFGENEHRQSFLYCFVIMSMITFLQVSQMNWKDARINLINEVLSGIKVSNARYMLTILLASAGCLCVLCRGKSIARTPSDKCPTPSLADIISTKPALIITFARCRTLMHMLKKSVYSAAP